MTRIPGLDDADALALVREAGPMDGQSSRDLLAFAEASTFIRRLREDYNKSGAMAGPPNAVVIDPDAIKTQLPEYNALLDAGRPDAAASAVHEESSQIAAAATQQALANNQNVVIDGVGNSGGSKFADKIGAAQAAGYDTSVRYSTVPTDEALQRAIDRANGSGPSAGRIVDPTLLSNMHATVSSVYNDSVSKIPGINIQVFDNQGPRGSGLSLIASRDAAGNLTVSDPAKYADFVAKGQ